MPSTVASTSHRSDPFAALDAVAQAALVRDRQASPLELVDAAIARVERLDPVLHAIAAPTFERARQQASEGRRGVFAGVPFLLKDLLPFPGLPLSCGSRLLAGHVSPAGSDYATALDEAGLIVVGTSRTSEFGLLGTTETVLAGPTRNPWDLSRSPAGSSGGAAAAVASGMVPFAHASDGGGSIRIPATVCGLFGLKPSRGRQRPDGMGDGRSPTDMLIEHCVSRSVRDSATLLAATQRTDPAAPWAPLSAARSPGTRRLRIGLHDRTLRGAAPDPEVAAALVAARRVCESLGHEVIETRGPEVDTEALSRAYLQLGGLGLGQMLAPLRAQLGAAFDDRIEPYTRELIERATRQRVDMAALFAVFTAAQRAAEAFQRDYDVTLCPTIPMLPFPLGTIGPTHPFAEIAAFTELQAGYTALVSIAGQPSMSVPLHQTAGGLPVGCQFTAAAGQDTLLLDLAYALEEAAPWADRWPPHAWLTGGGADGADAQARGS